MKTTNGDLFLLLWRALPGAPSGRKAHIQRARTMRGMIVSRFGESYRDPRTWQAKHVRWCLAVGTAHLSSNRRYRYWLTVRALASALDKWQNWEKYVRGPWSQRTLGTGKRHAGGRRPWLPVEAVDKAKPA